LATRELIGNALVSVYDKTGLDSLLGTFEKHNVQIIGSGGTAEAARKLGHKVLEVSEYTGFPEMPGGLVKTLHPKIHAGILGDWSDPVQRKYLEANGVRPLDFVVVNLYPFQEVVRSDPKNLKRAVDNIDIGGVALIRAGAKGALLNRRVVPVTNPSQYSAVMNELEKNGKIGEELRVRLAREAFALTAEYDSTIRGYLEGFER
jgi:phosphoribosylaminoimidazolecarboxamide formyltransferase/IMP cyclohydrolase